MPIRSHDCDTCVSVLLRDLLACRDTLRSHAQEALAAEEAGQTAAREQITELGGPLGKGISWLKGLFTPKPGEPHNLRHQHWHHTSIDKGLGPCNCPSAAS